MHSFDAMGQKCMRNAPKEENSSQFSRKASAICKNKRQAHGTGLALRAVTGVCVCVCVRVCK